MVNQSQSSVKKFSLLDIEIMRLKKKGFWNCIVALALYIPFFYSAYFSSLYIWTTFHDQIMIIPKKLIVTVGACLLHTLTALVCLLVLLPTYMGRPSWLDKYRVVGNKPWMWARPSWREMKPRTILGLLKSHLIYFPLGMLIGSSRLNMSSEGFPTFFEFYWQSMFILYTDDLMFFLTHRMLHIPLFYKHIHKQHHQYDTSFATISQYAHPFEYIFSNMMSSALAVFMLGSRLHVVTYLFFVILKVYSTNEGHSGFEVHWSPLRIIPFANGTSHHDFHHSKNVGNYGGYTYIWDYLTDNMSEYIKYHYYQSEPAAQ